VSLPGPAGVPWAFELLLFGAAFLPVGELVREGVARWTPFFRTVGLLERVVLDLYLGGAGLYVLAALPIGVFYPETVVAYLVVGAALLGIVKLRRARTGRAGAFRPVPTREWIPPILAGGAALGLFALELGSAAPVPTGNTFDSSILTDFVALLSVGHHTVISFAPIAPQLTAYPQGTTVWLGAAQSLFSLPPARTALLVTPLFFGLAPLGAYAWGSRALRARWAGTAFALVFALVGSWTRVLVAGSNDFVFAFPLVLLLAGWSFEWFRVPVLGWADALGFGALLGYSAALNPVGAEWLFPTLVVAGAFAHPRWAGQPARWLTRWLASIGTGLLFVIPSLVAIGLGRGSPIPGGSTSAGTVAPPPGISTPLFLGSIDPFLFGPRDVWLSPFVELRLELAVLIVAGLALLLIPPARAWVGSYATRFGQWTLASFGVAVAILGVEDLSAAGAPGVSFVPTITASAEVSILLFALYTAIAALPLVALLRATAPENPPDTGDATRLTSPPAVETPSQRSPVARPPAARPDSVRWAALALALALLAPGVGVTAVSFPGYVGELYRSFARVTPADFELLAWAGSHLPPGARVVVAPGSAAQFLPGYDPTVVLLFPVQPIASNRSYVDLVRDFDNGTLSAATYANLDLLRAGYVAVTGNNTDLWPPFSPVPFLQAPTEFVPVFHQGDAYLFLFLGSTKLPTKVSER
jgi:hypothetical protein